MHGLLALIVLVLDVVSIIHIAQSSMNGLKKALWIVLVLLLPVVGMLLWFAFGNRA